MSLLNHSLTIDASKHTLNTSGSKQKFSFPKAERFANSRHKSMYSFLRYFSSDIFYDAPSTKSVRTCTFGYGDKDLGIR